MLGLGFMYQQVAEIAQANQYIENEMPAGEALSSDSTQEQSLTAAKELIARKANKTAQIVNAISTYRASLDEEDVSSFADAVQKESEKYGYDWELILAIIKTESSLNARAKSCKGAIGLMQVMPSTAEWLSPQLGLEYDGHSSLYDPVYNVKLGTHYLHMLHQKFGNIEKAIAAYNKGPTGLTRYLRRGKGFPSRYLVKVMDHYKQLKDNPGECAS
jgi:soluble lytic murein transglycosylase